ncbi:MAG: hypothetical protein NT157_01335 [Candidatus Micrarchaeota archaeon]|nr:hypothetical protein [Candidatus Micrarchaeota archaeon]
MSEIPKAQKERIAEILGQHLFQTYDSLVDLRGRVGKGTPAYKKATKIMADIEREVDLKKMRPSEVRIDSSKMSLKNGKLEGDILLADNEEIFELTLKNGEVKKFKKTKGGFDKLEWIVTSIESSGPD